MGGLSNILLVSILINAIDSASPVLARLGIATSGMFGLIQVGALAVGAALVGVGVAAAHLAITFDQQMHKIYALTGISAAQMDWYKQKILEMAPALDQTPVALAQGLYYVISAGHSGADALNILSYSAKAAAAGMTSMQEVADVLTSAINSFKTQSLSAGHAIDDIMQAVVYGKIQLQQLSTGLAFVGVQAANAGFNFDETTAAVSALSQMAGNRGARRVMMDLGNLMRQLGMRDFGPVLKALPDVAKHFDLAKFAGDSFINKILDIAKACGLSAISLDQMRAAAHGNVKVFEQMALAHMHSSAEFLKLIGGAAAALPAFMLLQDKGKEYNFILSQMGGNGSKTAEAFDKMRQSAGQQINMLKVAGESILTVLGEQLLPVLNVVLAGLYKLAQGVLAFVSSAGGMDVVKTALLGIAIVVGAILIPTFIALMGTIAPITLTMLGIVAVGTLVGFAIKALVAHFGGMHKIMQDLHPLIMFVAHAFQNLGNELRKGLADPAVQQALHQLQAALPMLIPVVQVLAAIVGAVLVFAFLNFRSILLGLVAMIPGVLMALRGIIMVVGGIFRVLKDLFTLNFGDLGAAFQQIGAGLVTAVAGVVRAVIGNFTALFTEILQLFGTNGDKVKSGFMSMLGGIKDAVGSFFGGIGSWFGGLFGGVGSAVGRFFSGLGTIVQDGLGLVKTIVQRDIANVVGWFNWLYNHNYYFQDLVNIIRSDFLLAQSIIRRVVATIQSDIQAAWQFIKDATTVVWNAIVTDAITPAERMYILLVMVANNIRAKLLGAWNTVRRDVQSAWNMVANIIRNVGAVIANYVDNNIINPIKNKIQALASFLFTAGQHMIQMFINGMGSMIGGVGTVAKNIIGTVGHFLGFHSPAPGVPESAYWGPNLVKMFSQGMLSQSALASTAAMQVIRGVAAALSQGVATAGATGSAMSSSLASGLAGGGTTNITHNWAGAFPNATNKSEIMAVMREMQQKDYRAGQRAGAFGGLGVHTTIR